ncbi:MAG TPA: Rieske (2Fe-2S) protein, partial [Cyclobacteriaceae bacterium]|nr:Rieske (2Fe-2S) protein [Cyclobacteriaceae bacterium]
ACLGGGLISTMLSSCQGTHYVSGVLEQNGITVNKADFTYYKKDKPFSRAFVVIEHDKLEYPVYLYRISENKYNALWMKCTHQGSELQASGDHLYCSSHGSEFDKSGAVITGPAEQNLRSFSVSVIDEKIFIRLA